MSSESSSDIFPIGVLPARDGLMLFFTLPTVNPEEIEGMVQLQAEELSPYPVERTCVAWEKVWDDSSKCRVLVTLCDVSKLAYYQDTAHNDVDRIDVDLLAYWEGILKTQGDAGPPAGFHLLLIDEDLYLVAADEKGLCMTWTLQKSQDISAEDLEEDISLATTSIHAALSGLDAKHLTLWHGDILPEWTQELDQHPGGRSYTLKPLPEMREGLESRSRSGTNLDLLPRAWKEKKASRAKQKRILAGVGVLLILWVIGLGAVIGRNLFLSGRLDDLRQANMQAPTEKVLRLKRQVETLRPFVNSRTSALDSLLKLSRALPGNGTLLVNRFEYVKGERISCRGEVKGPANTFTAFLDNLAADEGMNVVQYDLKNDSGDTTFQIDLEWLETEPLTEAAL